MIIRKSDLQLVSPTDPILLSAPPLFDFSGDTDPGMLVNVLYDKMTDMKGVGLSANQVGLTMQVFVMGIGRERVNVFNPKIIEKSDSQKLFTEGCLSFPGIYIPIQRSESIMVSYFNEKGDAVEQEYTGLTARIFLHEYDHMLGKTMQQRCSQLKWSMALKKRDKKVRRLVDKYKTKMLRDIANSNKET